MDYNLVDYAKIRIIKLDSFISYLIEKGWKKNAEIFDSLQIWSFNFKKIAFPLTQDIEDFPQRIYEVLVELNSIERIRLSELIEEILKYQTSILSIRIKEKKDYSMIKNTSLSYDTQIMFAYKFKLFIANMYNKDFGFFHSTTFDNVKLYNNNDLYVALIIEFFDSSTITFKFFNLNKNNDNEEVTIKKHFGIFPFYEEIKQYIKKDEKFHFSKSTEKILTYEEWFVFLRNLNLFLKENNQYKFFLVYKKENINQVHSTDNDNYAVLDYNDDHSIITTLLNSSIYKKSTPNIMF